MAVAKDDNVARKALGALAVTGRRSCSPAAARAATAESPKTSGFRDLAVQRTSTSPKEIRSFEITKDVVFRTTLLRSAQQDAERDALAVLG